MEPRFRGGGLGGPNLAENQRGYRSIRDRTGTLAPVSLAELFITEIFAESFVKGMLYYSLITEIFNMLV